VSVALADCRPSYQKEIATRVEKLDKSKKWAWAITGGTAGGVTLFFGVMGILLIGPVGVLVGPQFGLVSSVVGLPLYIRNKLKKAKLKKLGAAYAVILASTTKETEGDLAQPPLKELHQKLLKKQPSLTLEQLKATIANQNDKDSFCKVDARGKTDLFTTTQMEKLLRTAL